MSEEKITFNWDAEIPAPWQKFYGTVPAHLEYPTGSMIDVIGKVAEKYPDFPAYVFQGIKTTYRELMDKVDRVARSFRAIGIKADDRVTVCMPNCPQALLCLYGLNRIGAIATMIHPLSSVGEIAFYIKDSASVAVVTLDMFYQKFTEVLKEVEIDTLVISSVSDVLTPLLKFGYWLTEGRKMTRPELKAPAMLWTDFLKAGDAYRGEFRVERDANDPAVILFSGGTTGKTKGILLSNLNFNALGKQTIEMATTFEEGQSMLAAMPVFHGFGLGVCIHTILIAGGTSILVPRVSVESYARLLKKAQPNYIAGVPTLYEGITRNPYMDNVKLSCLKGVFSGGDSLSVELKKKFDKFLAVHGASVTVREGYGTTECVTASCLTPIGMYREGSIGLPFPDTYYQIVKPGTNDPVPYGEDGEICLTGPTLMLEYINQPEETANTLVKHADGHVWLHTGDLGKMDEDGFVYFKQRIKRMIVTSGYNVYPSQLENIIDSHESVQMSCVIGVPDSYKMQKVKAFVVLMPGVKETPELKRELFEHCRRNIAKYAMPYEIEIRDSLPKTLVGKVAYTVLEKEELEKLNGKKAE
ncbi:MAG: AMP-binding protein [Clostridia bacterium]|nr:AMP-binding protein [Clostridia bacterium]